MSEFDGLWKHENNHHALVPPKTECGCPSGGGMKNGHIRYLSYGGTQKERKRKLFIIMNLNDFLFSGLWFSCPCITWLSDLWWMHLWLFYVCVCVYYLSSVCDLWVLGVVFYSRTCSVIDKCLNYINYYYLNIIYQSEHVFRKEFFSFNVMFYGQ